MLLAHKLVLKLGDEMAFANAGFSFDVDDAAKTAVLGGWQTGEEGAIRDILFIGASEGLTQLTVRSGLGLVPFAVDVHASQMGTLTRLPHAVERGEASKGWAIDENTMLEIAGGDFRVYGRGQAYRLQRQPSRQVTISIHYQ